MIEQAVYASHQDGSLPQNDEQTVFVFGSNLAGRHGRGAALVARQRFGACYGTGTGPTGRSYAIPTKDERLQVLPLPVIACHVADFIAHARENPRKRYFLTRIGCVLAGYSDMEIAPLFKGLPDNCDIPNEWLHLLS